MQVHDVHALGRGVCGYMMCMCAHAWVVVAVQYMCMHVHACGGRWVGVGT